MSVRITGVEKRSPAARAGIKAGDELLSVNGHSIVDVLDYMFYSAEELCEVRTMRRGRERVCRIRKSEYDDLGMQFASFLMDEKISCSNKCIFCFIDQMPPGMRETLYFKDDDARLSFLQGNYVTLTNLSDRDIERIIEMRLNINVSVHTTNPELRCKMMNNRFAGEKLRYLKMIADSGLMMNCQIVCCPGINDGDELRRTLDDLYALMPQIQSVAVVPVGLTKYREGLYPLELFDAEGARGVIELVNEVQRKCLEKYDTRMVFVADEFYLTAGLPLPDVDYYEDYPQYENGVGLCRSLIDEFADALEYAEYSGGKRRVTIACGTLVEPVQRELAQEVMGKFPDIDVQVVPIINYFFGETITVTGLITAGDLVSQLRERDLGCELLISKQMLKIDEPIFLDDVSLDEVEAQLGIKITTVSNDGFELLDAILGQNQ